MTMLEHGGNLLRAAEEFGVPPERWLDLSTGISPFGYPVPPVPDWAWQCLPNCDDALRRAAADYYRTSGSLPVPGTQAAIQALPRLRPRSRVMVPALTYNEHAHVWRRYGHAVLLSSTVEIERQLDDADVVVVCNPNNPTGELVDSGRLLRWHETLSGRGGWLVVDEAYVDVTPGDSLASFAASRAGLVVLRSLGKFFGLAGARVGFAFAEAGLLRALQAELGPWAVSGPAQYVARVALEDEFWQARTRRTLSDAGRRLRTLLAAAGLASQGITLFRYWQNDEAIALHRMLARQAVLTRRFDGVTPGAIRIGLPGGERDWQKLVRALKFWITSGSQLEHHS